MFWIDHFFSFIIVVAATIALKIKGGKTLGRQRNCVNAGYVWQEDVHRMQMTGEGAKSVSPLQVRSRK
jgi:hypothetical protein